MSEPLVPKCRNCVHYGDTLKCSSCQDLCSFQHRSAQVAGPIMQTAGPKKPTALPITAPGVLRKAVEIMEERGKQYDQQGGERSMGKAVAAFNIVAGRDLQESEGWLLLQILKDVRDRTCKEPHGDSLEDCTAYSALKAEARLAGK